MSIALVANTNAKTTSGTANSPITSPSINTTGANLLISVSCDYIGSGSGMAGGGPTISDSKSNSWSILTKYHCGDSFLQVTVWYSKNPTVGSGHTITITGAFQSMFFTAWSGADTSAPFDVENGGGSDSGPLSLQTGSITPSINGELLFFASCVNGSTGSMSVDNSFNAGDNVSLIASNNMGGLWAYKIQSTAAAINPAVSNSGVGLANHIAVTIKSFKPPATTTTTQTQPAKGRIQVVTTQTQPSKGRITATTTQTQVAKGRIGVTTTQTQVAKGRIQLVTTKTQVAKARIQQSTLQTQIAKARLTGTTLQTQLAKSRIQNTSIQTQTAKATLNLQSLQTQIAKGRVTAKTTKTQTAKGNIFATSSRSQIAKAKIIPVVGQCIDFEAFSIGQINPPVPNFVYDGTSYVASGGADGSTRFLIMSNSDFYYNPTFYLGGITATFNFLVGSGHGFPDGGPMIIFRDTNGISSHNTEIHVVGDGNLAVKFPDGSYPVDGLGTQPLHQDRWYWAQVNILYGVGLFGVDVTLSFYLDGVRIINIVDEYSGLGVGNFFGLYFNEVIFIPPGVGIGLGLDNLCLRPYTTSVIYPNIGTPNVRVAQSQIEVLETPSTANFRVAQGEIEVLELPSTSNLRVAQGFIELLTLPTPQTPQPPPDVPTPRLGRPLCSPQLVITSIPTNPPVMGQPSPITPSGPPTRTCIPQRRGQL